jgi:hypothetical protein
MNLAETIKQVQSEQKQDNLIPDICEFMGIDEIEFPGFTRNMHDTIIRVIYFAVRYKYMQNNYIEISKILNRDRSSCYYYKELLKNDAFMIGKVTEFLSKFNYTSQLMDINK